MNWVLPVAVPLWRLLTPHPAPMFEMQEAGAASMTLSIMLGAGVLVATQLIIVAIAVTWFVRDQRKTPSGSGKAHDLPFPSSAGKEAAHGTPPT